MSGLLRVYLRRLLGRRGVFLLRDLLSSVTYSLGLYERPSRPDGVSAIVISYNEEDWIRYFILSVRELVDEYIVMDSSTDRTPEIIRELVGEGLAIRYFRVPPGNIPDVRNKALSEARYKWILVWDADFVMFDEAVYYIRELIGSLKRDRHYLVYWPMVVLCGDICHVCSERPYHIEHWMYTYSSKTRYRYIGATDSLIAPLTLYRALYIERPMGIHINARSPRRTAVKTLWHRYRELFEKASEDFERLAERLAERDFGTRDLEEIGKRIIESTVASLPLYREEVFGRFPSVLRDVYTRCLERHERRGGG